MKNILIISLVFLLGGCAYIDQSLKVEPQVTVVQSNVGQGKKVALRVIDDREEQLIGKRTTGYGMAGAKINTDQDLVEILKNALLDGMKKKGFEPVGENDSNISLKAELRSLSYDTTTGLWTGGNIGKSSVKIIATQASGKTYEKTYRGQKEIRTVFIGSQETNAKVINEAFSEVLKKVFEDKELWDFLVQ